MIEASVLGLGAVGAFMCTLAVLARSQHRSRRSAARTRWCAVFGCMFLLAAGASLFGVL